MNGYAWGFFTPRTSLFRFRQSRGSAVAEEVFGKTPHVGVLCVDRCGAYNRTWKGAMQYCLEHFKRNVGDLLEEDPKNAEYKELIPGFLDLLREAMRLRGKSRGEEYVRESRRIRDDILRWIGRPVKDGRLKGLFEFMDKKRHRFFQWVDHPEVEAEDNLAERRLRPLVVARKVCFSSQSEQGLKTRETLMSVIDTLRLRFENPVKRLSDVLDALGRNPKSDVAARLWSEDRP